MKKNGTLDGYAEDEEKNGNIDGCVKQTKRRDNHGWESTAKEALERLGEGRVK